MVAATFSLRHYAQAKASNYGLQNEGGLCGPPLHVVSHPHPIPPPPAYRQAGMQGEGIHSGGYASRFVRPLQGLAGPLGLDTG